MGIYTFTIGKSSRYKSNERLDLTRRAARTIRAALVKPGTKVNKPTYSFKAHDPQGRIVKLEVYMVKDMKKSFPDVYRGLWPKQDEFIRTSFVTDLLQELFKTKLTAQELTRLKTVVDRLSSVRFPTRWSGFKLKGGSTIGGHSEMQHPTSPGTGIWIPSISGFSKAHTELDEARVKVAIDAINSFIQKDVGGSITLKPGATLEDIVKKVLVDVGTFTLSNFTAPAMAANVDATATLKVKTAQTQAREFVKDQMELLGAKRAKPSVLLNLGQLNQEYRPDLLQPGQISPRRGSLVGQSAAEKLW